MGQKKFYTAQDMRELKDRGVTTLQVTDDDIITDVSREVAQQLGIALNFSAQPSGFNGGSAPPRPAETGIRAALIRETARAVQGANGQSSPAAAPAPATSSGPDPYYMFKFRIFLDTADIAQLRDAISTGLVDGVATNPNKVAESGKSYRQVIEEIRRFFDGPIAVQAIGTNTQEVVDCARRLHKIDPLLAVKVTANKFGLAAVKILAAEGVRTNATLIYNPAQALLAGLAGSPFISPFIGRARDAGHDGIEAIGKMRRLMDCFGCDKTNLISASVKDVEQVIDSILAGAHSVAVPFKVFEEMCEHPLTDKGLQGFMDQYRTIPPS